MPLTAGRKLPEAASEVIRPLMEWPPAKSGRSGAALLAVDMAERTVSRSTGLELIRRRPSSV